MLEPSVVNRPWVRALATVGAVAAAAGSTTFMPKSLTAFIHIAAYGTWTGTLIWNTFFVGFTMFKNMPRQTFGRVQAQLFPQYFGLTTAANLLLLGTLLISDMGPSAQQAAIVLGVAAGASLTNWLIIEPVATNLMFQRYELENLPEKNEEVKGKIQVLYKQFGKYHGISSLINLVITCCAFAHAWYLGSHLSL